MPRSRFLIPLLMLSLAAGGLPAAEPQPSRFRFHHEYVLGTSLEIQVLATSEVAARSAEARVLGEIDRLARIYSTWDSSSEMSRWLNGPRQATEVSPELLELLQSAERWQSFSGGVFQPGAAALTTVWRAAQTTGVAPAPDELQAAMQAANQMHWRVDSRQGTAERLSATPLTFDALAKGAILDGACEVAMAQKDVAGVVINIGGDLRVAGGLVQEVLIADPRNDADNAPPAAHIVVRDRAVATSGDYRRVFRVGEQQFSRILDPRSGRPVEEVVSATVVADRAADADALATVCSVLSPAESLRLVESLERVECLLVTRAGQQWSSRGWGDLAVAPLQETESIELAAACDGTSAAAKDEAAAPLELVVSFELARPADGAQYRRPYVAVWLEDSENFPVKTALLWMQTSQPGPRWHRDLLRWYRHDKMRQVVNETKLIGTVSAATRGPGAYKAVFDGTDDEGHPLAAGKYTLLIEAAREHGTYQLIRQPVTLGGAAIPSTSLKGNVEIKSASFEYRPRSDRTAATNGN